VTPRGHLSYHSAELFDATRRWARFASVYFGSAKFPQFGKAPGTKKEPLPTGIRLNSTYLTSISCQ